MTLFSKIVVYYIKFFFCKCILGQPSSVPDQVFTDDVSDESPAPEALEEVPAVEALDDVPQHDDDDIFFDAQEEPEQKLLTLSEKLFLFFILFNISHRAMEYLLDILRGEGYEVPSSVYKLKKYNKSANVDVLKSVLSCGGEFAYIGIKDNIKYCIVNKLIHFKDMYNSLHINISIDGLPLYKSSAVTLWPILLSFNNIGFSKPLPVGIYVGISKPNFVDFISQLHHELLEFKANVQIESFFVKICKITFIADAPARAMLQCVKGHGGYNACHICRIPGIYEHKKVVYPYCNIMYDERTDVAYNLCNENNQHYLSPLAEVVSLKSDFPPEYMHLVCLGIMKRLLSSFLTNNHGLLPCRLSSSMRDKLESHVTFFKASLPHEFNRKIRSFTQHMFYKATEYRTLLLYTGPILFRQVLPRAYFQHFLLLHFAIYVFTSDRHSDLYVVAKGCIDKFLYEIAELFTNAGYTYNAHCLSHLYDFVLQLGPLDNFSAFKFENYLYLLKRRIKSGSFVLTQTVNSLGILRNMYIKEYNEPLHFSNKHPNNCAAVIYNSDKVYIIISSVNYSNNKVFLCGHILKFKTVLYSYPYPSSTLGIGLYNLTNKHVSDLAPVNKCIVFIDGENYIVVPFSRANVSC